MNTDFYIKKSVQIRRRIRVIRVPNLGSLKIVIPAAGQVRAQIGNGGFDLLGTLPCLEAIHHIIKFRRQILAHFLPHFSHHPSEGLWVFLDALHPAETTLERIEAGIFRLGDADARHPSAGIFAPAMGTGHRSRAVFAVGHEHVEALVTVIADEVIGWHVPILTRIAPIPKYDVSEFRE